MVAREFCEEVQRRFVVESGKRAETAGQVAEVMAGRRLAIQVTESFSFAEPVELGGDELGGVLVGRPGELGVEPQGRGALGVTEAAGDGVQIGACREQLGGGVVPQFLQGAGDADPAGVPAVSVGHGIGVPWRPARRIGGERVGIFWHGHAELVRLGAAAPEPLAEQLTGEQVQREEAAVACLGGFLDAGALLDDVVGGDPDLLGG